MKYRGLVFLQVILTRMALLPTYHSSATISEINSDHIISKVFTFGQTLIATNSIQNGDANSGGTRSNLVNVIRMMPYMPVKDPTSNGGYRGVNSVLDGGDPTNPIEDAELKNPQENTTVKILGNAFLEINILKGLQFRSTFGIDYANGTIFPLSADI